MSFASKSLIWRAIGADGFQPWWHMACSPSFTTAHTCALVEEGVLVEKPRRDDDQPPSERDRDDTPDTPPTDPPPVPIEEPPATPGPNGPYVVGHDEEVAVDGVRKERRGFASMSPEKQREIASKGGRAAHEKGTAHEWTPDEARAAGRKGGQISRGGRGRLVPSPSSDGSTLETAPTSGMEPGRAE